CARGGIYDVYYYFDYW
nr:immunoglobulin heavy chain junction region [Mus musculus]MBK4187651.1 immunoglobulin heavy chain junction region [Mus musculus]MBK4187652.1 immunoglobulin heavy chain junction region [Mus musculus]MBK4187653.1 immunoglobulin heavy chain junction region [Mus musculus]